MIRIEELTADAPMLHAVADLLYRSFHEHHPQAWPDLESARREVLATLEPGRVKPGCR